jgi:hypothetical protein
MGDGERDGEIDGERDDGVKDEIGSIQVKGRGDCSAL